MNKILILILALLVTGCYAPGYGYRQPVVYPHGAYNYGYRQPIMNPGGYGYGYPPGYSNGWWGHWDWEHHGGWGRR